MDESYSQDFYFIGAAVTTQENYVLREQIAADHGVPSNVEFHGHELMGGAGEWSPLRGKHREATGIYAAALRIAQEADVRYLFRGVDVKRLNARYRYPDQPHKVVLQHLLERVNDYRRDLFPFDTEDAIVVADEIATQEEHRSQFENYRSLGTPGYRSSRLDLISSPIQFASSKNTPGLQAVDLAVYLHRRQHTITESHPKSAASMAKLSSLIAASTSHDWTWRP
ncbi:DUF3800 domain-containing protein [Rathayibacter toxicus]|uniref:DUF3800 domain-containing protein n=1 Tax=Rathayibacter toxicus TaxID=145458 RepID=A0A2S5Y6I1_9MICO|nr:DUF3800 domain-containing protein [Rathayibacter toxicus]PPH56934.1 DUF3800 domain-containing protein [Rathayibacter toxicus]PPH59647.1 DUF3800 domain-containing protein [Rathayibacter toxicus]PPH86861.1 DUF3800 domain-containing protein [Rathayibacter toxicus]PPI14583.1 DUF3800 domain-containing protein [Rathayibacter toxicus]